VRTAHDVRRLDAPCLPCRGARHVRFLPFHQLERPLVHPKSGGAQAVSVQDPHEVHIVKRVLLSPFSAHEHIHLVLFELLMSNIAHSLWTVSKSMAYMGALLQHIFDAPGAEIALDEFIASQAWQVWEGDRYAPQWHHFIDSLWWSAIS